MLITGRDAEHFAEDVVIQECRKGAVVRCCSASRLSVLCLCATHVPGQGLIKTIDTTLRTPNHQCVQGARRFDRSWRMHTPLPRTSSLV
jgi:hypothetical protein